jgi:hypothetical protein
MADIPNKNPADENKSLKSTLADSKKMKKEQGDFNDLLKDSIILATKLAKTYDDINARVEALSKKTINVKDLEKIAYKARVNSIIAEKKEKEALANLDDKSKSKIDSYTKSQNLLFSLDEKYRKAKESGDSVAIIKANQQLEKANEIHESVKGRLNVEEMSAIQSQEANKQAKKTLEFTQESLKTEKDLSKNIGITGKLINFGSTKLGIFKDLNEKIVEETREGVSTTSNMVKTVAVLGVVGYAAAKSLGSGLSKAGGAMKGLSENSTGVVSNLTSGMSGMLKSIPMVGGLLGGLVDGFSGIADLLLGANDQIIKAGRNLGLSTAQSEKMMHHFQDVSFRNNDIFVTSKKLLETQVEVGAQLGINNQLTDEQLSTLSKLKDLAGIDAETQASIAESSTITGKSAQDTTKAVLAQVVGLQKATGISLNQKQVLKEASNLGGYLGLSFAKYPGQLSKALVTAKAFGLELKQLDSMADSFLDFESSISNEFEAQLLTGKDINLTKAREAFLNNDLAGAAQEISSQVGSSADFLKLNRIQAESMAKAFGMSRDQLGDMLKKQELLSNIGAKDTDNAQKQLQIGIERFHGQKELAAAIGEEAFQNMQNASTQEKIAAYIDKIKTSIVDFVERSGLIDKIQGFIDYLSEPKNMQGVLNTIKGVIASAIEFFGGVASNVAALISHMPFTDTEKWQDISDKIDRGTERAAASVRSVGGGLGEGAPSSISNKSATSAVNSQPIIVQQSQAAGGATPVVNNNIMIQYDPITGKHVVQPVEHSFYPTADKTVVSTGGH